MSETAVPGLANLGQRPAALQCGRLVLSAAGVEGSHLRIDSCFIDILAEPPQAR